MILPHRHCGVVDPFAKDSGKCGGIISAVRVLRVTEHPVRPRRFARQQGRTGRRTRRRGRVGPIEHDAPRRPVCQPPQVRRHVGRKGIVTELIRHEEQNVR